MIYHFNVEAAIIVRGSKDIRVDADNESEAEKKAIEAALDDKVSGTWRPEVLSAAQHMMLKPYPMHACPEPKVYIRRMYRESGTKHRFPWQSQ